MTAADKKCRAGEARRSAEQGTVSTNRSIPQKSILDKIIRLREKWRMLPDEWQRASIMFALMYLDAAPESIRAELIGKPSLLPSETIFICELFLLILAEAEARVRVVGGDVDPAQAWLAVLRLLGVRHE